MMSGKINLNPRDFLGEKVDVTIDRPLGSKHPKFGYAYPINYGYIEGTKAADGEEIDAYILGCSKSLKIFSGECIAIIHRINDNEDKLVIVPVGVSMADEEIIRQTEFQEKYFKSLIWRK